ncbi:MAG: prevent-host-death protein [Brasilonema octagenarum HA4186-MV1]|nr:prevent-host-death protein [Brasilonema octagenarum HA4186-MV1]
MNWAMGELQQKFSQLMNAAIDEPPLISNQEQLMIAVIKAEMFQEFLAWRQQYQKSSIADAFTKLRLLYIEEDYIFEIPQRQYSRF